MAIPAEVEQAAATIVDAGLKIHKVLGPGLLESAYEHCLTHELTQRGLMVRRQVIQPIIFGDLRLDAGYRIDMLVNDAIIVEVKAVDAIAPIHHSQLLTYLKLSGCRVGFLMNFNVPLFKTGLKRVVH